jgi:hypothetical protein
MVQLPRLRAYVDTTNDQDVRALAESRSSATRERFIYVLIRSGSRAWPRRGFQSLMCPEVGLPYWGQRPALP